MQEEEGIPTLHRNRYVGYIMLRRPSRHNRLQPADMERICALLEELRSDDSVRVVVLGATGKSFSSGFDLSSSRVPSSDAEDHSEVLLQRLCDAVEAFPRPTVCAINGSVIGGASDLALACDFRVGVRSTKLRMPAPQIGICFYPTGMRRYVSRIGLAATKRLFIAGEEFEAQELHRVGFLDEIVDDQKALDAAVEVLAQRIAAFPPIAVGYTKQALNQIAHCELDFEVGDRAFRDSLVSEEFAHALKAWTQRQSQAKASQ
ncbi:Short-chain-enoyl-CoA hydratase [compost metagenome]